MAQTFRTTLSASTQPALRLWDRIPIRIQGMVTAILPLAAVLISAILSLVGNNQRVDIETDIQRKFEMTAALGNLTTLMVNAETGMRGYLLTGQNEFLDPYDQAAAQLPSALSRLNELASAEPGEKPRIDKLARIAQIRSLSERQMADLTRQRDFVSAGRRTVTDAELLGHLEYGKGLMDGIRSQVDSMQAEERGLLDDRIDDINSIRQRDYISVAVALAAALVMRFLAWYLFRKGILHRVERLTENLRSVRNGAPHACPAPAKMDKMGELEQEVHLLGR